VQKLKQNKETALLIDIDWLPKSYVDFYIKTRKMLLEGLGYKLNKVIIKPSSSKRGIHVWLHIYGKPLTDQEKVKYQYLVGADCHIRSMINHRRVWRGIRGWWNKLFDIKHTIKPRPKRCQKCKIIQTLEELADRDDEYWFTA
jgi:hypothetical protein